MKELKTMRRGFAPIIAVAIVAAFLVGIGGTVAYFKFKSKPTAPSTQTTPNQSSVVSANPEPSSATDETANWKTYTNINFSIKYPPSWSTVEDPDGLKITEQKSGTVILTAGQETPLKDIDELVKGLDYSSKQKTTLGGQAAYIFTRGDELFTIRSAEAFYKGKRFTVEFRGVRGFNPALLDIFEEMVHTFKFL